MRAVGHAYTIGEYQGPPRNRGGRPATGRTTKVVRLRLPTDEHETLLRRAQRLEMPTATYAAMLLGYQLRWRPGMATSKRRRRRI